MNKLVIIYIKCGLKKWGDAYRRVELVIEIMQVYIMKLRVLLI